VYFPLATPSKDSRADCSTHCWELALAQEKYHYVQSQAAASTYLAREINFCRQHSNILWPELHGESGWSMFEAKTWDVAVVGSLVVFLAHKFFVKKAV
jgi:hypothetical protein